MWIRPDCWIGQTELDFPSGFEKGSWHAVPPAPCGPGSWAICCWCDVEETRLSSEQRPQVLGPGSARAPPRWPGVLKGQNASQPSSFPAGAWRWRFLLTLHSLQVVGRSRGVACLLDKSGNAISMGIALHLVSTCSICLTLAGLHRPSPLLALLWTCFLYQLIYTPS